MSDQRPELAASDDARRAQITADIESASEPIYPCEKCGKLRSKAGGGTVFTVCDKCWDELCGDNASEPGVEELPNEPGFHAMCLAVRLSRAIEKHTELFGRELGFGIETTIGDAERVKLGRIIQATINQSATADKQRISELERWHAKLTTVGCSCGTSDCDAGDCYGCRGHFIGILQEELAALQAENARLTRELAEARRALAAARITDADLSMIETDREPMD